MSKIERVGVVGGGQMGGGIAEVSAKAGADLTLAGFHALNYSMFDLAHGYAREQMKAYVELQEREFAAEERGYTATKHQREVGAGYFDRIATTVDPNSSTTALAGSTEEGQFH